MPLRTGIPVPTLVPCIDDPVLLCQVLSGSHPHNILSVLCTQTNNIHCTKTQPSPFLHPSTYADLQTVYLTGNQALHNESRPALVHPGTVQTPSEPLWSMRQDTSPDTASSDTTAINPNAQSHHFAPLRPLQITRKVRCISCRINVLPAATNY